MFLERRRGGVVLNLMLGVVTVAILGVCAIVYSIHRIEVSKVTTADGKNVTISTPAGDIRIRAHKDDGAPLGGLPVYPGATSRKKSGSAEFEFSSRDGDHDKAFSVAGGELVTPDSVDKVREFYRTELPDWKLTIKSNGEIQFEETPGARGLEQRRFVGIQGKSDGTHIGLVTLGGQPVAN